MDNSSQTLEMQIKAKAQEAITSVDKLINKLTGLEKTVSSIDDILKNNTVKNVASNINKLNEVTNKTTSSVNKLSNAFKKVFTFAGVKRVATTALGWMNEAIDYTEQLNLFNVVFDNTEKNGKQMFSELGKSALQFQYKLNEAFGTNKTQALYMQGIFQSMGETVGIKDNYSAIMSETMTKLTYDLASLYNKTENATAEAIRAGVYAGQTKPLRSYGIDVTQSSLQPIVKELGITDENGDIKSVKNMSQAEKEILRYIATLKQAKIAMGDLANTIESPSNQLKVFRQQLIETKTAFTSLFIGALSNALPYANAILMVIKEISKAIATMFGIELKDYNAGIASQEGIYDGIADSADDASSAVKELKRQTLGFDEIHNINENNNSGSGTSVSGGIDQRLLDAITGYDNGMDKVRMKATEIRDRIMDWLGFTKEIDPLTGEVSFKLKEGETRFQGILDFAKKIKDVVIFALEHVDTIIKTIIGYKILTWLSNVYSKFKDIKELIKDISGSSFAKWGLGIAGGIGLAQIISKTDAYQNLTGNQGTIFDMWGKIGSGFGDLASANRENNSQELRNLMYTLAITSKAKENGAMESYNWGINEIKSLYTDKFGTVDMEKYEKYKAFEKEYFDNKEYYDQKFFGESLFAKEGIGIADYTESLTNYFNTITNGMDCVSKYNQIIEESSQQYTNANEQLGILLAQMNTDQYEVTANDIDKINSCLQSMKTASEQCSQASVDAITKLVLKYQDQGIASAELTQQIITDAKKKQLAEQGFTEEYINKVVELEEKLSNGEITNDEYTSSLADIYNQYNKTTDLVSKKTVIFDTLSKNVDINVESFDDLTDSINIMKENYQKGVDEIETSSQNNLDFLSDYVARTKELYGEDSQEYANATKAIDMENESRKKSMDDLDKAYAISLNNILTQLVNSRQITKTEGQELYKSINSELSKIGYGVDGDVKKNLDSIKEQLKMNGVKLGSGITFDDSGITSTWNNTMSKLWNVAGKLTGGLFNFKLPSLSSLKIGAFANGGFPEDGLFFANHSELVGKFSNGKTAVANNGQIEAGIEEAAYRGYMRAIADSGMNGGQSNEIDVHVHTDEGTVIDRINQRTKQTGTCPINIPSY